MGQYYKPINLDKKEWVYTRNYKSTFTREDGSTCEISEGLKLMEHSYIGNVFMQIIENLLSPNGAWYKNRIVWGGDYADDETDKEFDDLKEKYRLRNLEQCNEYPEINLYSLMDEKQEVIPKMEKSKWKYIVNHTKKVYINKLEVKGEDGRIIHPLSLLTCEGNGRGGGDFRGDDDRIGTWARDAISMERKKPSGKFKEITVNFKYGYEYPIKAMRYNKWEIDVRKMRKDEMPDDGITYYCEKNGTIYADNEKDFKLTNNNMNEKQIK